MGFIIQKMIKIISNVNCKIQTTRSNVAGWNGGAHKSFIQLQHFVKAERKFNETVIRPALLYNRECWFVKGDHPKMSVEKIRMVYWMCGNTISDKVKNDMHSLLEEKTREICLK